MCCRDHWSFPKDNATTRPKWLKAIQNCKMCRIAGPGSSTAISSTAVSSTLGSSNPVSPTNKYSDFKVRLASINHFLVPSQ